MSVFSCMVLVVCWCINMYFCGFGCVKLEVLWLRDVWGVCCGVECVLVILVWLFGVDVRSIGWLNWVY